MITHPVKPVFLIKPVKKSKNRNILTRCVSGNDYSEQTFDDVDTVLVKYFTFRSTQYTLSQVYEMDRSPMKSEFNWLCDFANGEEENLSFAAANENQGTHRNVNELFLGCNVM